MRLSDSRKEINELDACMASGYLRLISQTATVNCENEHTLSAAWGPPTCASPQTQSPLHRSERQHAALS